MHQHLRDLHATVNDLFDLLDIVVVRLTLFALLALGAYALIKGHL
jgi:hypothetical protein